MKKRNEQLYVKDILNAIKNIEKYIAAISFKKFSNDQKTIDAVIRNLEIIGEASKKFSKETIAKYPSIPWKEMAAMRNKVVHEYFGVDLEIVWMTIKNSLFTCLYVS